jgi:CRP-like cAMP-binding protein
MPLFNALSRSQQERSLRELARYGDTRSFRKGETIVEQGAGGTSLFVILSGQVGVYLVDEPAGQTVALCQYDAVSYIGEMAMKGLPRCATVRAEAPTVCAEVALDQVHRAVRENGDLAITMIASLIDRHHLTTSNLRRLTRADVYGRLVDLLHALTYVEDHGERWSRERLTQREIGARVGASRDRVGRLLRGLEHGGYLRMRGKRFQLIGRLPDRW